MIGIVGWRKHFALVDVIDFDGLQYLRLDKVPDAAFRHNGNAHRSLDTLDHGGIAHARHPARRTNIGRNAFEGHNRASSRLLGDARLLGRGHIHNHTALEHLGKCAVEYAAVLGRLLVWHNGFQSGMGVWHSGFLSLKNPSNPTAHMDIVV